MSRVRVQDGRPLVTGTIKAEDAAAEIAGERVLTDRAPLTPAQQRAKAEDKYVGEDVPPGYESGVAIVSDNPHRPAGSRTPPPSDGAEPLSAWDRLDAAADKLDSTDAAAVSEAAAALRRDVGAHARKVAARAAAAKGTPHEAAAIKDVEGATELVKAAQAKIGNL